MLRFVMLLAGILNFAPKVLARNVYVNGIDISSARHQLMEGVTVRIDGDGGIYIEAPHYQVNEESTYVPLRRHAPDARPEHKPIGPLPPELSRSMPSDLKPQSDELPQPPPEPVQGRPNPPEPQTAAAPADTKASPPAAAPNVAPGAAPPLLGKEGTKAPGNN